MKLQKKNSYFDIRIDNRSELILLLSISSSYSDAKIVLFSYEKWGIHCTDFILGDFAFALWDDKKQSFFCARDRLGIKPFYYKYDSTGFYCSSEAYPLTKKGNKLLEPNIEAMKRFAGTSSSSDPSQTMYSTIFSLPPGHAMLFEHDIPNVYRYWFPEKLSINKNITFNQAVEQFKLILEEAIYCRMQGDTSVGFELSGGLDSSAIACVAETLNTSMPKSVYTNRFGTYRCDEGSYSCEVIQNINMQSYEFHADRIDYMNDYPLSYPYRFCKDWPIFATYTQKFPLAQIMHQNGIGIVLTGQGGDQVLTGNYYMLYDFLRSFQWLKLIKLWRSIHFHKKEIFKQSVLKPLCHLFRTILRPHKITTLDYSIFPLAQYADLQDICNDAHTHFVNNNAYNVIGRMYGIEFRHPFYDSRLVEFALSLPPEYKLWGDTGKIILREAMKGILPEHIRTRLDKAEMSELIRDQIDAIDIDAFWTKCHIVELGIIQNDALLTLIKQYQYSKTGSTKLWQLLNLEYWYRVNFIDKFTHIPPDT